MVDSVSRSWLILLAVLALPGCGANLPRGIPIQGSLTYQGQPLVGSAVYYEPVDKDTGRTAMGRVGENGDFIMRTSKGIAGVMPGEYRIRVEPSDGAWGDPRKAGPATREPPPEIPKKYLQAASSGLEDTVAEGHSGRFDIELSD